ncbi:hypothetical protein E2320_011024, partial [Naja naja]
MLPMKPTWTSTTGLSNITIDNATGITKRTRGLVQLHSGSEMDKSTEAPVPLINECVREDTGVDDPM